MVGSSPSASVAVAAQVMVSPTRAVSGVTVMLSSTGGVLSTVTETASVAVPPSPSLAITVQVMVSPGLSDSTSV